MRDTASQPLTAGGQLAWPAGLTVTPPASTVCEQRPILATPYCYTQPHAAAYDMHLGLELGIVLAGRMRRELHGWQVELGPGEPWFCGMWEPHGWSVRRGPCRVVVLVVLPQVLAHTRFEETPQFDALAPFTAPPAQRPRPDRATRQRLIELGERLCQVSRMPAGQQALWLRVLLLECLVLLPRTEPHIEPLTPPQAPAESWARIGRAVELAQRSRRLVTVAQAAAACGMGRARFAGAFERLMGLSFARFALRCRLSGAAAHLLERGDPLKIIADQWGFTDAAHLHRCFVQHYGCSPREYRRRREGAA